MTTPLALITTCVHCGERFDGGVAIIGRPNARMEALLHKLGSHMNTKHPEHAGAMGLYGAAFMGMLFLTHFKSTDAELNLHRDQLRWQIHQRTLNARFSDESLREQCAVLANRLADNIELYTLPDESNSNEEIRAWRVEVSQLLRPLLLEVFTGLRNDLEEPGKYATPEVAQVVV